MLTVPILLVCVDSDDNWSLLLAEDEDGGGDEEADEDAELACCNGSLGGAGEFLYETGESGAVGISEMLECGLDAASVMSLGGSGDARLDPSALCGSCC